MRGDGLRGSALPNLTGSNCNRSGGAVHDGPKKPATRFAPAKRDASTRGGDITVLWPNQVQSVPQIQMHTL